MHGTDWMITPSEIGAGRWWRFGAYEIRAGVIRPKPGANLEVYRPWDDYQEAREGRQHVDAGKRIMEPPYQSLIDLCRELRGQRFAALATFRCKKGASEADLIGEGVFAPKQSNALCFRTSYPT